MRLEDPSVAGAAGSQAAVTLASQLDHLDDGWHVIDAVDLGDRRPPLDRVVIGPGGVFVIREADHHGDRVWVRGDGFLVNCRWASHLVESRREVTRLDRAVSTAVGASVPVRGVVAVMSSPAAVAIKRQPEDVYVAAPGALPGWLTAQPVVLDTTGVRRIRMVLQRSASLGQRRAG